MTENRKIAKRYLETQIKTMRKYGSAPKLGKRQFKKLLDEIEKTFASMNR